jgi:hypothetical protein
MGYGKDIPGNSIRPLMAVVLIMVSGCISPSPQQQPGFSWGPQAQQQQRMTPYSVEPEYSSDDYFPESAPLPPRLQYLNDPAYWKARKAEAPAMYERALYCREKQETVTKIAERLMEWLWDHHEVAASDRGGYIPNSVVVYESKRIQKAATAAYTRFRYLLYSGAPKEGCDAVLAEFRQQMHAQMDKFDDK